MPFTEHWGPDGQHDASAGPTYHPKRLSTAKDQLSDAKSANLALIFNIAVETGCWRCVPGENECPRVNVTHSKCPENVTKENEYNGKKWNGSHVLGNTTTKSETSSADTSKSCCPNDVPPETLCSPEAELACLCPDNANNKTSFTSGQSFESHFLEPISKPSVCNSKYKTRTSFLEETAVNDVNCCSNHKTKSSYQNGEANKPFCCSKHAEGAWCKGGLPQDPMRRARSTGDLSARESGPEEFQYGAKLSTNRFRSRFSSKDSAEEECFADNSERPLCCSKHRTRSCCVEADSRETGCMSGACLRRNSSWQEAPRGSGSYHLGQIPELNVMACCQNHTPSMSVPAPKRSESFCLGSVSGPPARNSRDSERSRLYNSPSRCMQSPRLSRKSSRLENRSLEQLNSITNAGGSLCPCSASRLSVRNSNLLPVPRQSNEFAESMRTPRRAPEACSSKASLEVDPLLSKNEPNNLLRRSLSTYSFGGCGVERKDCGCSPLRKTSSIFSECASDRDVDSTCIPVPAKSCLLLSRKSTRCDPCTAADWRGTAKNTRLSGKMSLDSDKWCRLQQSAGINVSDRPKGICKVYQRLDEFVKTRDDQKRAVLTATQCVPLRGDPSLYSLTYNDTGETARQRSCKITPAAKVDIEDIRELLNTFFQKLQEALEALNRYQLGFCGEMVCLVAQIQQKVAHLLQNLRYGAYEKNLDELNCRLVAMVNELKASPPLILLRLVEFGFNMYELGNHLNEDLLPSSFAQIVHRVQTRIYRLQTGRIVRQIYFVPTNMDPMIGTYFKSRRLVRLEQFCHCNIVLLPPDDPRSRYCPVNYRTIEVNYDALRGRHVGFQQLLYQCAPVKSTPPRLVASIFKRLSGTEFEVSPKALCEMKATEARISYTTIKGDMANGTGLAIASKLGT